MDNYVIFVTVIENSVGNNTSFDFHSSIWDTTTDIPVAYLYPTWYDSCFLGTNIHAPYTADNIINTLKIQAAAYALATYSLSIPLSNIYVYDVPQTQADWNQSDTTYPSYIRNKPAIQKAYNGTTQRTAFPFFQSATVASGVAVYQLTADGTSTGAPLFPNGIITSSINTFVSDATASYQMSYALTNSNKTLTVTANKLTTANILTGLLGQSAANGAVVNLSVWGY